MEKWRKPIRTAIQGLIALISVAPILLPALGPLATTGVGAAVLTVSATLARVMQNPRVETFLETLNLHSTPSSQSGPNLPE